MGASVSISGDGTTIAIGTPQFDGMFNDIGKVDLYDFGLTDWVQIGTSIVGEATNERLGNSTDLSNDGNTFVVGAPLGPVLKGVIRVYSNNTSGWTQVGEDIDGVYNGERFGSSTSISLDGLTIAVGVMKSPSTGANSGQAKAYYNCGFSNSSININSCGDYISPSGSYTWNSTGVYVDTLIGQGSHGCDSIITINLTVNTINTSVSQTGITLIANNSGAIYQWLDCNSGYLILANETNAQFTPQSNGSYAVEVSENNCVDTSSCFVISTVATNELNLIHSTVKIFPNPANSSVTINKGLMSKSELSLINSKGVILHKMILEENLSSINLESYPCGVYYIKIIDHQNSFVLKFVKQ